MEASGRHAICGRPVDYPIPAVITMPHRPNDTPHNAPHHATDDSQNQIFKPRIKSATKVVDPNQLLYAEDLLCYYQFALEGRSAATVLQQWAATYPVEWIRLAIIEALYQGRYKAVSVAHILQIWERRSQAQPHFDDEFAQMIRQRLPDSLVGQPVETTSAVAALAAEMQSNQRLHQRRRSGETNRLDDLTEFVQTRRSRLPDVDTVINHAEAHIDRAAQQAKQQLTQTPDDAAIAAAPHPISAKAIHQFRPKTENGELIARLRSVSSTPPLKAAETSA
jgi:hypothetical protein